MFELRAKLWYLWRRLVRLARHGHWRDDGGEEAAKELRGKRS